MENKQLEWKGRGWSAKRAAYNGDEVLQGLLDIARSHIPAAAVHVDSTEDRELWHRSRVRWDREAIGWDGVRQPGGPKAMEVYYHSFDVLLPVLAHECGHLETMASMGGLSYYSSGSLEKYKCEYIASRWALGYLKAARMPKAKLEAARELLQGCLDNYREGAGVYDRARPLVAKLPGRAVLSLEDVPNLKQKKQEVEA